MPAAAMMVRSVTFQPYRRSFPCFFFFGPERANNFICMEYDNLVTDLRRRNDEAPRANDERTLYAQMATGRLDALSSLLRHSSRHRARSTMAIRNDLKAQVYCSFMLLSWARSIRWNFRRRIACLNNFIIDQIFLDFLAAHIRKHLPVDFNTRRQRLSALGFHLAAKCRLLNDVLLRVRKVIFCEHGTHAGAPATIRFQISGNFGRLHRRNIPRRENLQRAESRKRRNVRKFKRVATIQRAAKGARTPAPCRAQHSFSFVR